MQMYDEKIEEFQLLSNKHQNLESLYRTQSSRVEDLFKEAEQYLLKE